MQTLPGEEPTMLQDMFKVFMGKYRFMAIWHAIEMGLGMIFFSHIMKDAVYCSEENGNKWMHTNIFGALFAVMHILGTMQACGVARTVFIKTVKADMAKKTKGE